MSERVVPAAHREPEGVTMARHPARTRPSASGPARLVPRGGGQRPPDQTPGCAPPRRPSTKIAAKRDSIT